MTTTASTDLIRASWALVTPQSATFAETFYGRLFMLDPQLQAMFRSDMAVQRDRLMAMLDAAVGLLGQPARLMPALRSLGSRHGGYGVKDAHYVAVGQALLDTLAGTLGSAFTSAVRAAWTDTYNVIARVMMDASAAAAPAPIAPAPRAPAPAPAPAMAPRISAMSALALVMSCTAVMPAGAQSMVGWHPATSARPAMVAGIDANTFIVGHPASPTVRAGHANGEHPAVLVMQAERTRGIDANTFIVQPPVAVTWRYEPALDDGARYAHAGRQPR